MALTPASILADYTSGIGTQGATLKINTSDKRIGIGTTNPQGTLQVGTGITMGSGIITATAFVGSGANLTGVISGVELKSEGNSVGTAITAINFVGFNSVTAPVGGLSTATSWEVYDTWLYGGG